jgi:hypothetical protein
MTAPSPARSSVLQLVKALWMRWKVVAHRFGNFQARVILTLFYFVIIGPFAVMMKFLSDPLALKQGHPAQWIPRRAAQGDISIVSRRQF